MVEKIISRIMGYLWKLLAWSICLISLGSCSVIFMDGFFAGLLAMITIIPGIILMIVACLAYFFYTFVLKEKIEIGASVINNVSDLVKENRK